MFACSECRLKSLRIRGSFPHSLHQIRQIDHADFFGIIQTVHAFCPVRKAAAL